MIIKKNYDDQINDSTNKLLQSFGSSNNETVVLDKSEKTSKSGLVDKPSIDSVVNDKEWVDYGSRL